MNIWYGIFQKVVNMSVTGAIVILGILLIRALLCKAPKRFSYMLWGIVLFRLLCPISLPSAFSVLNLANVAFTDNGEVVYIPWNSSSHEKDFGNQPVAAENGKEALQMQEESGIAQSVPMNDDKEDVQSVLMLEEKANFQLMPMVDRNGGTEQTGFIFLGVPLFVWFVIWILGFVILVCSGVLSTVRLYWQVACAMQLQGNIYLADHITSPFVLGVLQPKIYLPSDLGEEEQAYIILHEKCHIVRRDYLVKILAYAALCLHWFNPFAWLAFMLAGKDMEMSCDEAVMRKIDGDIRAEYAKALLQFTVGKRRVRGMPLAFGEGDVKSRIKNVMNYKKPATAVAIAGMIVCFIGGICFLTNPMAEGSAQKPGSLGSHGLFGKGDFYSGSGKFLQIGNREQEEDEEWEEKVAIQDAAIQDAIMEHNQSFYPESADFACCNFVSLERRYSALANKYTFYGWAFYAEYDFSQNGLKEVYSTHVPVALKFQVDKDGYELEEYWEPGNGSVYVTDIRRKFPAYIAKDALDGQKFLLQQIQDCYSQAVAFGQATATAYDKFDIDTIIGNLLHAICSDLPSEFSNPQEYIDAHEEEYRELIYYGGYTVRYCLKRFEQGEETGLEGHIMARICEEISGIKGKIPVKAETADTGQAWYNGIKNYAGYLLEGFIETEEINPYEEIGIPVSLPENKSWIQERIVKESDENHLQIQYYDSVLEGQCTLWVVKDGEIDLPDIAYEEDMDETWEGHTLAERRVIVRVQHAADRVLASWEYENYKFAILGEVSSQQSDTLSVPKTALGIIMGLM